MRRLTIDPLWLLALVLVVIISAYIALGPLWPLRAAPAARSYDYGYTYQTTPTAAGSTYNYDQAPAAGYGR